MGKFYGVIGYAETTDMGEGVWKEQITERSYYGDVFKESRRLQSTDYLNDNIIINNLISIVADPYAYEHFHNIRYITWMGTKWQVTQINVQRPRLVLSLGGVYNGE